MENELINIKNNAVSLILESKSKEELESLRVQFLGRNGALTLFMKEMVKLPVEQRAEIGRRANEVKQIIENALTEATGTQTKKSATERARSLDITDPGIKPPLGHLHLITQAIDEISAIFEKIGFTRVRYPEIEWDWYAFEGLNFPENHPARDDWETFFIKQNPDPKKGPVVLTPHTSSGQIRQLELQKPPIRMLNIAKCYRRQSDVSHTAMFHQFETLVVDKHISIAHLKGVLDYFVKSWFGPTRRARIRPYHFQFTEPSFETDVSCGVCDGTGVIQQLQDGKKVQVSCRICKEGWLELGGAGMVHPNVLKNCGIDPNEYSGFASGWGVERVLMMKEGIEIDDLRLLYSNNLEFLEQF
jgi:phenylalanyl-tRNA synthetase alpha chain